MFLNGGLLVYQSRTKTIAQTTNTKPIAINHPQIVVFFFFLLFRSIQVSL